MQKVAERKITKDAIRSTNFGPMMIEKKKEMESEKRGGDSDSESSEDDDDEIEHNKEDKIDDFLDREDFDQFKEVFKAKHDGEHSKKNHLQWSGEDVLEDYDPKLAADAARTLGNINVWP
jgi:hypothetical protein